MPNAKNEKRLLDLQAKMWGIRTIDTDDKKLRIQILTMKNILLKFSFCLLGLSSYGQIDTNIYGIAQRNSPAEMYFAKINPLTGVVTEISTSSFEAPFFMNSTTLDPINKIYYFMTAGKFVSVDIATGNMISNPPITAGTNFFGFLFNSPDSTVYGLAKRSSPTDLYFAKINPSTGVVTDISPSSLETPFVLNSTTIDPINKIYYLYGSGKLLGIDMTTGNIVKNLTIATGTNFFGFLYNGPDSTVYGLAQRNSPSETYFAKINTSTGVITDISTSPLGTSFVINSTTIDPINKIYYLYGNGKLLGIDMTTGNIVRSPTVTAGTIFYGFRYGGTCCNAITSVSIPDVSKADKVVVYPNPFSSETTLQLNRNVKDATLIVYNSFGQQVKQIKNVSGQTISLNRDNLPSGLYHILLSKDNKAITTERLIITN